MSSPAPPPPRVEIASLLVESLSACELVMLVLCSDPRYEVRVVDEDHSDVSTELQNFKL